jgi:hypothetical protein
MVRSWFILAFAVLGNASEDAAAGPEPTSDSSLPEPSPSPEMVNIRLDKINWPKPKWLIEATTQEEFDDFWRVYQHQKHVVGFFHDEIVDTDEAVLYDAFVLASESDTTTPYAISRTSRPWTRPWGPSIITGNPFCPADQWAAGKCPYTHAPVYNDEYNTPAESFYRRSGPEVMIVLPDSRGFMFKHTCPTTYTKLGAYPEEEALALLDCSKNATTRLADFIHRKKLPEPVVCDTDGGPWPCTEKGCPGKTVSCPEIAKLKMCEKTFGNLFAKPPEGLALTMTKSVCCKSCAPEKTPAPPPKKRGAKRKLAEAMEMLEAMGPGMRPKQF